MTADAEIMAAMINAMTQSNVLVNAQTSVTDNWSPIQVLPFSL